MGDALTLDALQAVLSDAPRAVVVVGRDSTIRFWNPACEALLGWSAKDVLGRRDPSVEPDQVASLETRLAALLEDPSGLKRRVLQRRRPDGSAVGIVVDAVSVVQLEDGPGLTVWASQAVEMDTLLAARNLLSRRLVTATRAEDVTPVIVDALGELLGAPSGLVLRACPDRRHLHGLWGLGMEQETAEAVELPVGAGAWDGAMDDVVARGELQLADAVVPALFVPMGPAGGGWVLAVLEPGRRDTTSLVDDLARAIADETYVALQRAELVSDLDGKIEILEATATLASSVGLDLADALKAVATQAAAALSCERSAVYLVEDDAVVLAHVHDSGTGPEPLRITSDGLRLAEEVVRTEALVLRQDVSACELADGPWHEDAGTVAVLGLPLVVGGRVIGALLVAHTIAHPRGFTSLCTQVGAAVAQQAAIAVEQARLYEVERDTVVRLRELDRLKADWMAGLTHDLRAPLTGLLGFVETLRRLTGQVTPEQQREFLEIMARQAGQLVAIVEDLLLSARIDADAVARRRELIPVGELITGAAEGFDHEQQQAMTVEDRAPGASVVGDSLHLQRVVQNLISNAWRHGATEAHVIATHQGGDVVVTVDDDGPGIPVEDWDRVFDRFQHGDTAGSTGLGLYVARGIAEAHGGSLQLVEPTAGRGARFELRLPHSRRQREDDLDERESTGAARPSEDRRRAGIVDLTV